jgi:predicted NBD/HSP70 family sugar kinase
MGASIVKNGSSNQNLAALTLDDIRDQAENGNPQARKFLDSLGLLEEAGRHTEE